MGTKPYAFTPCRRRTRESVKPSVGSGATIAPSTCSPTTSRITSTSSVSKSLAPDSDRNCVLISIWSSSIRSRIAARKASCDCPGISRQSSVARASAGITLCLKPPPSPVEEIVSRSIASNDV